MTRPFFTRERISDFDIYDRNCDKALEAAKGRLRQGHPIEFQVKPSILLQKYSTSNRNFFAFRILLEDLLWTLPPSSCLATTLTLFLLGYLIPPRWNTRTLLHSPTIPLMSSSVHSGRVNSWPFLVRLSVTSGHWWSSGRIKWLHSERSWTILLSHWCTKRWRGGENTWKRRRRVRKR